MADGSAFDLQGFVLFVRDVAGFVQALQPVLSFVALFQGDLKFRDKILCTLCVLRFMQVNAD